MSGSETSSEDLLTDYGRSSHVESNSSLGGGHQAVRNVRGGHQTPPNVAPPNVGGAKVGALPTAPSQDVKVMA
jgi:hypothetical protein